MGQTIVITGGAGFVGSNLAISFKRDMPSSRVVALDNLKRRGSELNIPRLREAGIEFIHGDIRSPEDLEQVNSMDVLIECSAEPSVLAGYGSSPLYVTNTNLVGTINCLELARKFKADVVFLSTSRVYPIQKINVLSYLEDDSRFQLNEKQTVPGVSGKGISEQFSLEGARSLYGATKLASELILTEYIDMYGIRGVTNRCGVLTGPWQMGKVDQGVVVLWVARHVYGRKLAYLGFGGTGKQVRDILHVQDLYDLLKLQLNDMGRHSGQNYNVGGGQEVSLSLCELTNLCREATGRTIDIESVPETRVADIKYYISDCTKVMNATGWSPKRQAKEIVQEIADWIEDNKTQLKSILS